VLGGYHNFMLPIGFGFHKVIYKKGPIFPKLKKINFMLRKGINIFKIKLKLVLTMLVFKNLKIISYPLPVSTNHVLLYIYLFKN
jgi:hypothetical protein